MSLQTAARGVDHRGVLESSRNNGPNGNAHSNPSRLTIITDRVGKEVI